MKNPENTLAVAKSLREVETAHPELYALLSSLSDALAAAEVDPESDLAEPASALVDAFSLFPKFPKDWEEKNFIPIFPSWIPMLRRMNSASEIADFMKVISDCIKSGDVPNVDAVMDELKQMQ